jgi:hypothetical protein
MSTPTGAAGAAAMIDDEGQEWRQRLRQRSEAALRRREARAAARRVAALRRAHGLVDRQTARLAGPLPPGYEPDLACTQ